METKFKFELHPELRYKKIMDKDPADIINDLLNLDISPTIRGDELKGYIPDRDGPGRTPRYLNKAECLVLSRAFARAAKGLTHLRKLY